MECTKYWTTNSSGFTGLGGAYRNNQLGTFTQPAFKANSYWWTKTELTNAGTTFGRAFSLVADFDFVRMQSFRMDSGYYVRAVKSLTLSTVENNKNEVKTYPNPASNFITISGLTNKQEYLIYSILGTKISNGIVSNNEKIEISNLSNGLYFLKFNNGNTVKFIKE